MLRIAACALAGMVCLIGLALNRHASLSEEEADSSAGLTIESSRDLFARATEEAADRGGKLRLRDEIKVSVIGEVKHPGAYLLRPGATVVDAVAKAGGPADIARLSRVAVIRGDQKIATINLKKKETGTPLADGDTIEVPSEIY